MIIKRNIANNKYCLLLFLMLLFISFEILPYSYSYSYGSFEKDFYIKNNIAYPFMLYIPKSYDENKSLPLVIFLHGAKERGNDGYSQCLVGLGPCIKENTYLQNSFILFPQILENMFWASDIGLEIVLKELKMVIDLFSIDISRIYLTGISMGGTGVWVLAEKFSHLFAAIVPIAAFIYKNEETVNLINTNIWAFQSKNDSICPPNAVKERIEFLKSFSNLIQYSEYKDYSHRETWEKAYNNPELYEWLFSKNLTGN